MTNEERKMQDNKMTVTVAALILTFVAVGYILLHSTINDTIYFHYVINGKGEQIGLFSSIIMYLLLLWIAGAIFSSVLFLFTAVLYEFLDRKEERRYGRDYEEKKHEEMNHTYQVSFSIGYIATFIIMVLNISNLITTDLF